MIEVLIEYLAEIERHLDHFDRRIGAIMAETTQLTEAVSKLSSDVDAVVVKLNEGAKPTQAEVDQVTEQVRSSSSRLETALSA